MRARELSCTYQPSGEYERAGLWGIPLGTALISAAAASVYTGFNYVRPFGGQIIFLALAGWAFLVLFASGLMVRFFKMRRPALAAWLAGPAALVGWLVSWLIVKQLEAPDQTLPLFLSHRFSETAPFFFDGGWTRSGLPPQYLNGLLLLGGWILEPLAVGSFAVQGAKLQAARPFSEMGDEWLSPRRLNLLAVLPKDYRAIIESLAAGDLGPLKVLEAKKRPGRLFLLRFETFICIYFSVDEAAGYVYVTLSLMRGEHPRDIIKNLELTTEESAWILDKFDRAAD